MGLLQSLVERVKSRGKKKVVAGTEPKPRASIVLPTAVPADVAAKPKKVGDYMERGADQAQVLAAKVKAVTHTDLTLMQTTTELHLDSSWSHILDD